MKINFESALEKIGRIISRQYGIEVRFEGNQAFTDGKKIVLPHFESMDEELARDMNGYLDHEVAHCKFTDFSVLPKIKTRFHKELLNAVEDSRIEKEMIAEYPGCALHLDPLNNKMMAKIHEEENWSKLPYPVRTIIAIRDLMDGRTPRIDEDIERYVDAVKDAAVALRDCKNTEELRVATEEIIKKIIEEREEEKKEEKKKGKKEKGEKGEGAEGESAAASPDGEDKSESSEESSKGKGKSKEDAMLTEKDGKEGSEFDKHTMSIHDLIEEEMKEAIDKDAKEIMAGGGKFLKPEFGTSISIPTTTKFDRVTDHSGKGDKKNYARLKSQISKQVSPIKQSLERVLKVKENAKWKTELERGKLNTKDFAKLATDKSYRTPFKDFRKTETTNVAVELLIDMSGSMMDKIQTAKMAAIAMSEALKGLDISFEVTGFNSISDSRMAEFSRTFKSDKRFNRFNEILDLHIFKSFDNPSLLGLDKIHANSQNPDGECVAWAAKRLALRKEKRKILIVFSDGQPATGEGGHRRLCTDLKKKIDLIIKSGIEVVGIGIETDAVKSFYPDYLVLSDVAELPKAGMRTLSRLIQG